MDPRDRLLGPIAWLNSETDEVSVDFGDLIRKLILSEEFVFESIQLKEVPLLARKFGYDGLMELLRSRRVLIQCEAMTAASTGQTKALPSRVQKGLLPPGSYCFDIVKVPDHKEYIHHCLQPIDDTPGLRGRQGQKIRKAVAALVDFPPSNSGARMMDQLKSDFDAGHPVLKESVALAARERLGKPVTASDFDFALTRIDEDDVRAETDLDARLGLDDRTSHEIVERGLLGVAGLNQRLELMERFQAVTGFRSGHLPLFEDKLSFLARQLDPDVTAARFERVVEIADLPDVDPDPDTKDVDLARLLEVAQTDEARAFRGWLRGIDSMSEDEIEDQIRSLRDTVGAAFWGPTGKAIRFATTTGLGLIPDVGGIAGPVAGGLDSFVLEKLIPGPGPTAFVSQLYPSVFRGP